MNKVLPLINGAEAKHISSEPLHYSWSILLRYFENWYSHMVAGSCFSWSATIAIMVNSDTWDELELMFVPVSYCGQGLECVV